MRQEWGNWKARVRESGASILGRARRWKEMGSEGKEKAGGHDELAGSSSSSKLLSSPMQM